MRLHASLLLLLLTATGLAQTKSAPPEPITYDQAVANEQKLFAADQKHDMDTIKSLVADDFVDIAEDGSSIGKGALLKEIPTSSCCGTHRRISASSPWDRMHIRAATIPTPQRSAPAVRKPAHNTA